MSPLPVGHRIENPDGTITIRLTRLRRLLLATGDPNYVTAALCRIPPYTLSLYAQGKKDVSKRHMQALCEVLECSPGDILGWETFTLDPSTEDESL